MNNKFFMAFKREPGRIQIFDTTNRDGEQATAGARYGAQSKMFIAKELAAAGIDRIEAGFPSSSPEDFESVRAIARAISSSVIFGLARVPVNLTGKLSYDDIDRTFESVKDAQNPGIHAFSIMFDPPSLKAYGYSRNQVVEGAVRGVARARELIGERGQVEFSFQNAASAPLEWIVEGYQRMVEAGANVINIPDTNGTRTPAEIRNIVQVLRQHLPQDTLISIHAHNDLGLAVANSLAAVQGGADIVEGTINGIGERAGNTALEEVIVNILFRPELYDGRQTRVDAKKLNYLSQIVGEHYGLPVQEHKAIVGANAFRHRSGIHQDGQVKGGVYEFIPPEVVGWTGESFELSARSGASGVRQRLNRLGYEVSQDSARQIMPAFKALADEKRIIGDTDLVVLMDAAAGIVPAYALADMRLLGQDESGNYQVEVSMDIAGSGRVSHKSPAGEKQPINGQLHHGPISAIFGTIDGMVNPDGLHLVSYKPVNIGVGKDAVAEVTVVVSRSPDFDGRIRPLEGMYVGRGRDTDTLRASALAYVDALSKAITSVK